MSTPENTPAPRRPRRRNRTLLPVATATAVAFVGVTGFLGTQMANGKDPLLGAGKQASAQVQPATVKKVVITRKVIVNEAAPASAGGVAAVTANGGSYSSAPVQQSVQVQSAPAPAPAPVQTGSS